MSATFSTNVASGTTLEFRFYGYSSEAETGTWRINDGTLKIQGTVSSAASAPTLTSPTATSIGQTAATLGANITSDGGASLSSRGTVYGATTDPTGNGLAEGGTATGTFTDERTGLSQGTKYFYRGYAANSAGTGYSPSGSFHTEPAQATGISFANVTATGMRISWTKPASADGVIVVVRAGNSAVTDPTDGTLHSADAAFGSGANLGSDSFVVYRGSAELVDVTSLSANTTYYVEIFAYKGTVANSGVDQGINYGLTPFEVSATTNCGTILTAENIKL